MANSIHVALRFNNTGMSKIAPDPILEHRNILTKAGKVGFGKVGKPLSEGANSELTNQIKAGIPTFLHLLFKSSKLKRYECYKCQILGVYNQIPTDIQTPDYYRLLEGFGTWFVLKTLEPEPLEVVENLRLASTGKTLGLALRSMSPLFIVEESKS